MTRRRSPGLRALASYRLGDTEAGEIALRSFLARENPRVAETIQLARQFSEAGRPAEAQRLYLSALATDPQNQAALAAVVTGASATGDQATLLRYTPDLLRTRKPSRTALTAALAALSPDDPAAAHLRTELARVLSGLPAGATVPSGT